MAQEIVIVGQARTAIGSFQGALSSVSATELGARVIQASLERAQVSPQQVSEVLMGNVIMAGVGQAPARQAAIRAGIPTSVPAATINKVCGSGMKAIISGVQSLLLGDNEIVVSGGMENMSMSPYLLPKARTGLRMGHHSVLDSMLVDGLWDPYHDQHMGNCAELCAKDRHFSREQQDEYAAESFRRAQAAQKSGQFAKEIVPVEVPGKKGEVSRFEVDEGPAKVQFDKIPQLKPVFDKQGTVTAANSSTINDGAAALVLTTREKANKLGLKPLARILSYGGFAQDPLWFTTAPSTAMKRAMDKVGWKVNDVDLFEVNEAFAVVALAARQEIEISKERFNACGGAISLGHPIGASGARIVITLVNALHHMNLKRGVAGICIGGGEATAVCVERL